MLKEEQGKAIAGFNSILVWSSGVVGETVGVSCFFFIFQNACRAFVFTINKGVTFNQLCACL